MKMKAYSVYDKKALVWTQPFFQLNDQVAQRVISNATNSEGHNFNLNPEDYELYFVGEWNDEDGIFTSTHTKILDLITLQRQPPIPNLSNIDPKDPNLESQN